MNTFEMILDAHRKNTERVIKITEDYHQMLKDTQKDMKHLYRQVDDIMKIVQTDRAGIKKIMEWIKDQEQWRNRKRND